MIRPGEWLVRARVLPLSLLSLLIAGTALPAEAQASREDAGKALVQALSERYGEELGSVLERIDEASGTAADAAELAAAVADYARLVNKIDSDLHNAVALIESLPHQKRQEARVKFLLAQGGHILDYDSVRDIVFGGAEIGVKIAAVAAGAAGGGAAAAIDAAQFGMEVLEAAGSGPGSPGDPGRIETALKSRLVLYHDGQPWVLSDEELAWIKDSPGATLQERFENSTFFHDGELFWLTPEWRGLLDSYAADKGLADDMPWTELYGRYLKDRGDDAGGVPSAAPGEDREQYISKVRKEEPAVWACGRDKHDDYRSALDSLARVGYPKWASKYKPGGPGASWQEDASDRCIKAYEAAKAKGRGAQAWDGLQRCAWGEESAKRYETLKKKFDECRVRSKEIR